MKNSAVKIFLAVILAVVAGFGIIAVVKSATGKDNPTIQVDAQAQDDNEETQSAQQPDAAKAPVTLHMLSVGDNLIHDGIYEQAQKRAGGSGYDFSFAYKRIADTVGAADIATINQETPIAQSYSPSGYPLFNSPKEVGNEIVKIGFDIINLANNHMIDKGAKGLAETIDFWDAQASVVRTGAYKNTEDLTRVEYIEKDGIKIGLVGVTQYTNGLSLPNGSELKIIYSADEDIIESKIKEAKAACDMVLVNVHWGNEYTTTPVEGQRSLAKKMAAWGADVIIGHHPHVIEPVEWIENDDGTRTLCAYSLGNFISQQNTAARVIGGVLHYDVTKDFASGKVTVSNVVFEPIVTHYVRGSHDVQIYPLSQYTDKLAKAQASRIKQSDFSTAYIREFVSKVIDSAFLK